MKYRVVSHIENLKEGQKQIQGFFSDMEEAFRYGRSMSDALSCTVIVLEKVETTVAVLEPTKK